MAGIEPENIEGSDQFAQLTTGLGGDLSQILLAEAIVPGSEPSYQLCKMLYTSHFLGQKMTENPILLAQSQEREITVPGGPEERLIHAFKKEWRTIGGIGADNIIKNVMTLSRIYGIASLGIGDRQHKSSEPLDIDEISNLDLFFSAFDPLNTAGSLILTLDPNSPDFLKPRTIRVAGQEWHPSRTVVMMNEHPIYLSFTNAAFGFVGRSVFQRALYPLKSAIISMVADQLIQQKLALLIWKAKSPSSAISNRMMTFFGWKRQNLKAGVNGQVLQIGVEEDVASLNFQNAEGAGRFTRENILKNIATAAGMPARMLDQETLVSGFGEGSEDAKAIARYIDRVRLDMTPLYDRMDDIVMRRAWSPDFYEGIKKDHPEFRNVPYTTAFQQWKNNFQAIFPNLLTEPDSEKAKVADIKFKSTVAMVEVLAPLLDPENKAALVAWASDQASEQKELFTSPLVIDEQKLAEWQPPMAQEGALEREGERMPRPKPFQYST
jgi:hypothetical protein